MCAGYFITEVHTLLAKADAIITNKCFFARSVCVSDRVSTGVLVCDKVCERLMERVRENQNSQIDKNTCTVRLSLSQ